MNEKILKDYSNNNTNNKVKKKKKKVVTPVYAYTTLYVILQGL